MVAAVGCAAVAWMRSEAGAQRRAALVRGRELFLEILGEVQRSAQWGGVCSERPGGDARSTVLCGAIVPVLVGEAARAVRLSAALEDAGFWVPAIRYPTVARGAARLRITLSACHKESALQGLGEALGRVLAE